MSREVVSRSRATRTSRAAEAAFHQASRSSPATSSRRNKSLASNSATPVCTVLP